MLKLITKYKMWILVVFGIMIMIAFLLGDFLQRGVSYANDNAKVYTIGGQKVTRLDYANEAVKTDGFKRLLGEQMIQQFGGTDFDPVQYRMMAESGKSAGLYGGPDDGRSFATELASARLTMEYGTKALNYSDWQQNMMSKLTITKEQIPQRIDMLADTFLNNMSTGRGGTHHSMGAEAFAEFKGFQRLADTYISIPRLSENRLVAKAREFMDEATVQYLWVPVNDSLATAAAAPTPEELAKHFADFKDVPLGSGQYGMGLKQPDRITYSYFRTDKAAIEAQVTIDPIEVQKRLLSDYKGDTTDPAALRKTVEATLKTEQVNKITAAIENAIKAEILRATANLSESNGYKVLPTNPTEAAKVADLLSMCQLAVARVNKDLNISISGVSVTGPSKLSNFRDVIQDQFVGSAVAQKGRDVLPAWRVLFMSKEFARPMSSPIPCQLGLPITEPFRGQDGCSYFFVLNSVVPTASPASLDEVKAQVEIDAKKIKAIESVKKLVTDRVPVAIEFGMNDVVNQLKTAGYPALTLKTASVDKRQGMTPQDADVLDIAYIEEIMLRAAKLDPTLPIERASAPERTWVSTIPGKLGVVLTQITEYKPLTAEMFRALSGEMKSAVERNEFMQIEKANQAFSRETMLKRLKVDGIESEKKSSTPQ